MIIIFISTNSKQPCYDEYSGLLLIVNIKRGKLPKRVAAPVRGTVQYSTLSLCYRKDVQKVQLR